LTLRAEQVLTLAVGGSAKAEVLGDAVLQVERMRWPAWHASASLPRLSNSVTTSRLFVEARSTTRRLGRGQRVGACGPRTCPGRPRDYSAPKRQAWEAVALVVYRQFDV
jgi:hypothetical protein